jgi:hypothetical protein
MLIFDSPASYGWPGGWECFSEKSLGALGDAGRRKKFGGLSQSGFRAPELRSCKPVRLTLPHNHDFKELRRPTVELRDAAAFCG